MLMEASTLPLEAFRRGKVRDVYIVDDEPAMLVATTGPRFRRRDAETFPQKVSC